MLSRAKFLLPFCMLKTLYYAMIYPYLTYCNMIWGCGSSQILKPITVLQKRAIRIITGSTYLASTSEIFARTHVLKFADIRMLQVTMFMFKFKLGLLPYACHDFFHFVNPLPRYETRKTNLFLVPYSRTEVRKKSINVYGPDLWNMLPADLQNATTTYMLKRRLTNLILAGYSD